MKVNVSSASGRSSSFTAMKIVLLDSVDSRKAAALTASKSPVSTPSSWKKKTERGEIENMIVGDEVLQVLKQNDNRARWETWVWCFYLFPVFITNKEQILCCVCLFSVQMFLSINYFNTIKSSSIDLFLQGPIFGTHTFHTYSLCLLLKQLVFQQLHFFQCYTDDTQVYILKKGKIKKKF